ncbi:SRPBCC family protein [Olivibacter domesticus]|uniref:Uncharacterized conserved protein YndB, AHSA1/START domain n=1 Tax=Olivibacter domesticus TaxID=407022 RepID=A0A1H7J6S1_OLID1|nr:SRPBCC domain-containing protein [Olivibacter domesticus]SEK68825.1 Uncharacterized conserved protein YndB, AHSA1/START domain [Olivibacter domesticus]
MSLQPLIIEKTYQTSLESVWKALTDKDQMKEWYFELQEFKPEVGFEFQFYGGSDDRKFLHMCTITEVEFLAKLSYTWRYKDYPGQSIVTFELFKESKNKTRLKLTHTGLESFPQDIENFAIDNFRTGWNFILGESLPNYVETATVSKSISIKASAQSVWNILLHPNNQWGQAFGEGAFIETDWQKGSPVIWKDIEGNIGANGIVMVNNINDYLQVGFYDEVNPPQGTPLGSYVEKFKITENEANECILHIEAGLLSKKDVSFHSQMWDKALEIMKTLSEKK